MIDAKVYTPDGKAELTFNGLDRVSYVNAESFGPGSKIGNVETDGELGRVLVLNVNGFAAAQFDITEDN